jgi:hypothetical protein
LTALGATADSVKSHTDETFSCRLSRYALPQWPNLGQDDTSPPSLSLVKAAQIAEEKIAEANLPPDNFLRSIRLVSTPKETFYYASFEPPVPKNLVAKSGASPLVMPMKFMCIDMDGSASFVTGTMTVSHSK